MSQAILAKLRKGLTDLTTDYTSDVRRLTLATITTYTTILTNIATKLTTLKLILGTTEYMRLLLADDPGGLLTTILTGWDLIFRRDDVSSLFDSYPQGSYGRAFNF